MVDSISKAMELARNRNRGHHNAHGVRWPESVVPQHQSAFAQAQPEYDEVEPEFPELEPAFPDARSVEVTAQTLERNRLIGGLTDQRVIDCYSLLRARLLHRVRQRDLKTIGVTSPSARDGKTLTATNLAISVALGGTHSVLLVDADIRRPSVASLFGLKVSAGLSSYLSGDVQLNEVLLKPPIDNLVILPGNIDPSLRPEALSSDRMLELIAELRARAHGCLVIFDLCPALVGGDVVTFAPNLDGTLLVVAEHRTNETALERTLPLLEGANVIGTVLNFAEDVMSSDDYYSGR
ncbi:CpsD/CapB family tyrosine-protein kinase [Arhodomonas sp. AD133]|uniref:CpsD/CapB family tyrosine-protein kinase n=1 Tax=Arhodomonas sp. AD133 TaxID=3415009 RepID=UPI003EB9C23D